MIFSSSSIQKNKSWVKTIILFDWQKNEWGLICLIPLWIEYYKQKVVPFLKKVVPTNECKLLFPPLQKAEAEIEEHLKTAEMLSLKGDTRGQKEQIVNELIKVHQRFHARIHEYQILLKMTIQFFKNLDQVNVKSSFQ